jgi:hypothetical protein
MPRMRPSAGSTATLLADKVELDVEGIDRHYLNT